MSCLYIKTKLKKIEKKEAAIIIIGIEKEKKTDAIEKSTKIKLQFIKAGWLRLFPEPSFRNYCLELSNVG